MSLERAALERMSLEKTFLEKMFLETTSFKMMSFKKTSVKSMLPLSGGSYAHGHGPLLYSKFICAKLLMGTCAVTYVDII